MNKDLTCNQVSALINFYVEGKLNPRLREYVDIHLSKCPACKKKIKELQKILTNFDNYRQKNEQGKMEPPKVEFLNNLSAYMDNELDAGENIKIKKMAISNPSARKELESMYRFKKIVTSAYEKTKNDTKFDYSKDILSKIQDETEYTTNYFYKLAGVFLVILAAIISGFIYLYF